MKSARSTRERKSVTTDCTTHWAICDREDSVIYDDANRAEVYWSKALAVARLPMVQPDFDEPLHVESVDITDSIPENC